MISKQSPRRLLPSLVIFVGLASLAPACATNDGTGRFDACTPSQASLCRLRRVPERDVAMQRESTLPAAHAELHRPAWHKEH